MIGLLWKNGSPFWVRREGERLLVFENVDVVDFCIFFSRSIRPCSKVVGGEKVEKVIYLNLKTEIRPDECPKTRMSFQTATKSLDN